MLLRLHLPTPQGMVAIGGGVVVYVLGELLSVQANLGTRDGEVDRGDFAMRFQADMRAPLARRQRAAQLNRRARTSPRRPSTTSNSARPTRSSATTTSAAIEVAHGRRRGTSATN